MAQVLIWKKVTPGSEYDFSGSMTSRQQIAQALSGGVYNIGNRLWLQGLMSAIDTGENRYEFLTGDIPVQQINERFDFIILPMANIFNRIYRSSLISMVEQLSGIRIPIYVIACGVQADSYDKLDMLIEEIGDASTQFIRAVYNTKGEFALRGWFTKEFFTRLGFSSAVVTGCPSLYQMGRDLCIRSQKRDRIKPIFNGSLKPIMRLLDAYPGSIFYDQDLFMRHLYQPGFAENTAGLRGLVSFYCDYGPTAARMLANDRIRLIPEMGDWWNEIRSSDVNVSFGSRIHGSIMPILAGVPAIVLATDSRTREMAEFFDIPHMVSDGQHVFGEKEFEKICSQMDYSSFNASFSQKFDAYERFLTHYGIVSALNQNNSYFKQDRSLDDLPQTVNQQAYAKVAKEIADKRLLLQSLDVLRKIKGRIRN